MNLASGNEIVDTYCNGGFPTYNNLIKDLVIKLDDVQTKYVDKYMCTSNCACPKVNATNWGLRY